MFGFGFRAIIPPGWDFFYGFVYVIAIDLQIYSVFPILHLIPLPLQLQVQCDFAMTNRIG